MAGDEPGSRYASAESRLNARLWELMDTSGVNQVALALAFGQSQSWVSKRLNGILHWRILDLDRLAEIFHVAVPELFFDTYKQWDRRTGKDRRNPQERRKAATPIPIDLDR